MPVFKKVEVTPGVFWVEVPQTGLRVLCGCPADSVKHLMKMGLILSEECCGVRCETGPNAILLSDSLIQNGTFANLAEFPVLQMLYRQGILLPGHPNNTGRKPLLMGSEAQVRSQLRYIYRGNYGLISVEELMAAGMSRARAREEMRLKRRFAFDDIAPSESFLDTLAVGPEPVEIYDGTTIRRTAHNVFEFDHGGESVSVDLNLPRGQAYQAPYPLAPQRVDWPYFGVIHSGDGDGWDVNRPTMASIVVFQGDIYLIDAGPNLDFTLTALGIGVNEVRGIFHTHAHDDHFCGLTTLMQADHCIEHYATPPVRASVAKKWSALLSRPESEFGDYFKVRDLREGRWNDISGLQVKPVFSPHPLETTIMFFRAKDESGWRTYAHLADVASSRVLESFHSEDPKASGITRRRISSVWRNYLAPADVKKIDIGGGLIHGEAEDFKNDKSGKIILSHTALPLTDAQKEIGSGASFGMVDALIRGEQDFIRSRASTYLRTYLPGIPKHDQRMLHSGGLMDVNPETILLKRGRRHRDILMVVTGVVEMLDSEHNVSNRLLAGALIGEQSGLSGRPSRATYRALTHVRVLRLPRNLFLDVIRRNGLDKTLENLRERREFLQQTRLFGAGLSPAVQNSLAGAAEEVSFAPGQILAHGVEPAVFLVSRGRVEVRFGERVLETLDPGGFIGEGFVLFNTPCITSGVAMEPTRVFFLPASEVRHIPAVRWRLFETYRRRAEAVIETSNLEEIFQWRDEYSTGVDKQDRDHRKLLQKAEEVHRFLKDGCGPDSAMDDLAAFAREHFARELVWYEADGFPELEHHRALHDQLLDDVRNKMARYASGSKCGALDFAVFFKNWLIDHIMTEDRKYGGMMALRSQG